MCVLTVPILIEGEEACREQRAGSLESKTKGNIAAPSSSLQPSRERRGSSGQNQSLQAAKTLFQFCLKESNHTPVSPSQGLQHFNNCAVKPSAPPKGISNEDQQIRNRAPPLCQSRWRLEYFGPHSQREHARRSWRT